mmetsp:Transcript_4812/g.20627  ORF Transcript_4812/g.20627 Transcript_4812/m.20627 type:complete len:588 (-) Transcript_4812:2201-3964(-)
MRSTSSWERQRPRLAPWRCPSSCPEGAVWPRSAGAASSLGLAGERSCPLAVRCAWCVLRVVWSVSGGRGAPLPARCANPTGSSMRASRVRHSAMPRQADLTEVPPSRAPPSEAALTGGMRACRAPRLCGPASVAAETLARRGAPGDDADTPAGARPPPAIGSSRTFGGGAATAPAASASSVDAAPGPPACRRALRRSGILLGTSAAALPGGRLPLAAIDRAARTLEPTMPAADKGPTPAPRAPPLTAAPRPDARPASLPPAVSTRHAAPCGAGPGAASWPATCEAAWGLAGNRTLLASRSAASGRPSRARALLARLPAGLGPPRDEDARKTPLLEADASEAAAKDRSDPADDEAAPDARSSAGEAALSRGSRALGGPTDPAFTSRGSDAPCDAARRGAGGLPLSLAAPPAWLALPREVAAMAVAELPRRSEAPLDRAGRPARSLAAGLASRLAAAAGLRRGGLPSPAAAAGAGPAGRAAAGRRTMAAACRDASCATRSASLPYASSLVRRRAMPARRPAMVRHSEAGSRGQGLAPAASRNPTAQLRPTCRQIGGSYMGGRPRPSQGGEALAPAPRAAGTRASPLPVQ